MRTTRKHLASKIVNEVKELKNCKAKVKKHHNNLLEMIKDHRFAIFSVLLPAFVWGWKKGTDAKKINHGMVHTGARKIAARVANIGVMAALAHLKKRIIAKM